MVRTIVQDDRGELVYGAFWEIWAWKRKEDVADQAKRLGPERMIVTGSRHWIDSELIGVKSRHVNICPVDPAHLFASVVERATYVGEEPETGNSLYPAAGEIVVARHIARRVLDQKFKGLSCLDLDRSDEVNLKGDVLAEVALLQGTPKVIARNLRILPEGAKNDCYNCGFGPIVCLVCKEWHWECPRCKTNCCVAGLKKVTEDERRMVLTRDEDRPVVLDGTLWDGEDALLPSPMRGGHLYTRRVVEFLLSLHLDQIAALTVPVYVGGCTPEQRNRIVAMAVGR
jgi:hypothetical protein